MQDVPAIDLEHLDASLEAVAINVTAHYKGARYAYRSVATELRKLLCDSSGKQDKSLLPRCLPSIRLNPLAGDPSWIDDIATLVLKSMRFDGDGKADISEMFGLGEGTLSVDAWRDQTIFAQGVTLRSFIRSIADKEGAHADASRNAGMQLTHQAYIGDAHASSQYVIAIGRYVARAIVIEAVRAHTGLQPWLIAEAARPGHGAFGVSVEETCFRGLAAPSVRSFTLDDLLASRPTEEQESIRHQVSIHQGHEGFLVFVTDLSGRGSTLYAIRKLI